MNEMWLIVGLGNPGLRYKNTWHNLGFMVVDRLAKQSGLTIKRPRFLGKVAEGSVDGVRVCLLKPYTYMNVSGQSVQAAASYLRIPPERVVVICDDLDLAIGKIRIRGQGSAGSHNGLRSVQQHLGQDYVRLRLGMGPRPEGDLRDVVLDKIAKAKQGEVDAMLERATACLRTLLNDGLEKAQQLYN